MREPSGAFSQKTSISHLELPPLLPTVSRLYACFEEAMRTLGQLERALERLEQFAARDFSRGTPESLWTLALASITKLELLAQHQSLGLAAEAELVREIQALISRLDTQGSRESMAALSSHFYRIRGKVAHWQHKPQSEWWWIGASVEAASKAKLKLDPQLIEAQARAALRLGFAQSAISLVEQILFGSRQSANAQDATVLLAQAYRLSGRPHKALAVLQIAPFSDHSSDATRTTEAPSSPPVQWQLALLEATRATSLTAVQKLFDRGLPRPPVTQRLEAYLWLKASCAADPRGRLARPSHIRRSIASFQSDPSNAILYRTALQIENALDQDASLPSSLESLLSAYEAAPQLPSVEQELLVLAAITRRLWESEHFDLAQTVLTHYRSIGLRLSDGRDHDPLRILASWPLAPKARGQLLPSSASRRYMPQVSQLEVRSGIFPELLDTMHVANGLLSTTGSKSLAALRSAYQVQESAHAKPQQNAWRLLKTLSAKRKGVMLKVRQMTSYLDEFVTEIVRDDLNLVEAVIPPAEPSRMDEIFQAAFGLPPTALFSEWNYAPTAQGSIGQINKAKLASGESVAVKIQHPDIKKHILLDMRRARVIRPYLRARLPSLDFEALLAEAYEKVVAETDYVMEADMTKLFSRLFGSDPRVSIPNVHDSYSKTNVLVTDWIEGQRFQEFAKKASQPERDAAGALIYEVYLRSVLKFGIFNCDPNLENFLFSQDRVHFLDFGCVKRLPKHVVDAQRQMYRVLLDQDAEKFTRLYVKNGFVHPEDRGSDHIAGLYEGIWQLHLITHKHLGRGQTFTFSEEHTREVSHVLFREHPFARHQLVPKDYLFLIRFEFGLIKLLGKLRASANWRHIVEQVLK